jgi:hypothetical protein
MIKFVSLLLLFLLIPCSLFSEPQIKQFFPSRSVLLGQPLFWMIELRHPMWESYQLKLSACPSLTMAIADRTVAEVAGEIKTVYKISVIPTVLKQSCTPSVTISDEKGQTTVLSGKLLQVLKISGNSLVIKNPVLPPPRKESSLYSFFLYSLLVLLGLVCALFAAKRFYNNLPAQRFLREVRKAVSEVSKGRLPIQVWRLLRSKMIWGFEAEAFTPAQLQQKATSNSRLARIAVTLQSLESWRYSGSEAAWDHQLVAQALENAEILVRSRPILQRFSGIAS